MTKVVAQTKHFGVALILMWAVAKIPLGYLSRLALPLYIVAMVLLVLTALIGDQAKGAQRWLDLQVIRIQPSELMKIALPLMLAWYFDRYERVLNLKHYFIAAILMVAPVILILKQPDLGTSILVLASGFFVLFFAGMSLRVLGFIATISVLVMPFAWSMLEPYQQTRVLTLLNPASDPLGAGYHTIQSTIAIGSGGFWGKGWMEGTQSQLNFLPEGTTDFVFAVLGEEFGLMACIGVLLVYTLLVLRGIGQAVRFDSLFTSLVALGVICQLGLQALINMASTLALIPTKGMTLPFISYGGSSLLGIGIGLGMTLALTRRRLGSEDRI